MSLLGDNCPINGEHDEHDQKPEEDTIGGPVPARKSLSHTFLYTCRYLQFFLGQSAVVLGLVHILLYFV